MKLLLPDGTKLELDTSITYDEKKAIVDNILDEWQAYFTTYRSTKKTTVCLEVLSNYLYYHKEKTQEVEIDGEEENKDIKY